MPDTRDQLPWTRANRLQVLEVLVLDAEPDRALAQLFFQRLDQLDQGERVGLEVVDERLTLADRRRLDLQDVGQPVTDDLEDGVAVERSFDDVGLRGHEDPPDCVRGDAGGTVATDGRVDGSEPSDQEALEIAARSSSTMRCSTISAATLMPFTMARALDEPWEMMQTPSTPSRIAPP